MEYIYIYIYILIYFFDFSLKYVISFHFRCSILCANEAKAATLNWIANLRLIYLIEKSSQQPWKYTKVLLPDFCELPASRNDLLELLALFLIL